MVQNINHYNRLLGRAHTNYLAQVNVELSQTYRMGNKVMNRLTFLATVFLPLTIVCGLFGMNVKVRLVLLCIYFCKERKFDARFARSQERITRISTIIFGSF